MAKTLGAAPPPAAPAAVRATRPGWRDPRLWLGVAIVAICVTIGARLLAAADDTVAVWALRTHHAAGSVLDADDLAVTRVRFADPADLGGYYRTSDPLPARVALVHDVGAGELLPRGAVDEVSGPRLAQLPVAVDPTGLPAGLAAGTAVDLYVVGRTAADDAPVAGPPPTARRAEPVLAGVRVVDVAPDDLGGPVRVTLALPARDVAAYFTAVARVDDPALTLVGRP